MSRIDRTERAKLTNGSYVYGEYNEIEEYCKKITYQLIFIIIMYHQLSVERILNLQEKVAIPTQQLKIFMRKMMLVDLLDIRFIQKNGKICQTIEKGKGKK